jgi:hypothetical protein
VLKVWGDRMFAALGGIAVGPNGDIAVVDASTGFLSRFDSNGTLLSQFNVIAGSDTRLANAHGVAFDRDGNLLIADGLNRRVVRYTPTGTYLGAFGTPGYYGATMQQPYGVAQAPNGDILVADFSQGVVSRWESSSGLTPTSTVVSGSGDSAYGDSVTFTATVTGATGNGSVAFQEKVGGDWITVAGCNAVALGGIAGNSALTGSFDGLVSGDDITATWSTDATRRSDAGDYATHAELGGAALRNYDVTARAGTLTVTKRPLSAVANDVTRPYGQDNPTLGGTLTGVASANHSESRLEVSRIPRVTRHCVTLCVGLVTSR